jgi:hypothetical protein
MAAIGNRNKLDITTIPKETAFLIMDYTGNGRELSAANRSLRQTRLDYIWGKYYLPNPFLSHLCRLIPLEGGHNTGGVYRHIQSYMQRNGLRPPANDLLIRTAEEFGAAHIREPTQRRLILLFTRLTPLFLRMPENESFHRLWAQLQEISKREPFSIDDLVAPISHWLLSPESLPLRSRIVRLDLSQMGLERIPGSIGLLPNLEVLDLRNNQLREAPHFEVLRRVYPSLRWIRLDGNPFRNSSESSAVIFEGGWRLKLNGTHQDGLE